MERAWFEDLNASFPDPIAFAQALSNLDKTDLDYAFAFGVAQGTIKMLLAEVRRLEREAKYR